LYVKQRYDLPFVALNIRLYPVYFMMLQQENL